METEFKKNNVVSQSKFTKGNWYLQTNADAYTNIIRCNSGKGFETVYIASTPQITGEEFHANAQLMAASPDLLKALEELISLKIWKDKFGKDSHYLEVQPIAWENAQKAIDKALILQRKDI